MKLATPDNVFLVSGFIGTERSKDSQFVGHCIAEDKAEAIRLMARTVTGLNPVGVTSLQEMSQFVKALEDVQHGRVKAPTQPGYCTSP